MSKKAMAGGPLGQGAHGGRRARPRGADGRTRIISRSAGRCVSRRYSVQSIAARVPPEGLDVVGMQPAQQPPRARVVEHAVELDVGAVDLGQPPKALERAPLLVEASLDLLAAGHGHAPDHAPSQGQHALTAVDGGQELRARGVLPVPDLDRQALLVGQGALLEVGGDDRHRVLDEQRVARARDHRDGPGAVLGRVGGRGEARAGHEVDRDEVEAHRRVAREARDEPSGVGEDDRVGHLEPLDPAREGEAQGRLDDRRAGRW